MPTPVMTTSLDASLMQSEHLESPLSWWTAFMAKQPRWLLTSLMEDIWSKMALSFDEQTCHPIAQSWAVLM